MKLVCAQTEFNSALQLVSRAVASRPTHPVLANVLLTADQGTERLSLTGFDLNLGIQTSFSATIETSGAITLPAKLLVEIVARLSTDSPITLISDDLGENVELISSNGSYQMRGMSSDDYPELPLVQSGRAFKVNRHSLIKALKSTIFASSSDEAKQLLTGVHLSFNGCEMISAATDGHRLAVLNIKDALESESANEIDDFAITLPSRSLREVERLMNSLRDNDTVSLFCDQGQVVFLSSDQVITSRTLEGDYPKYSQLIPSEFSRKIYINRNSFIQSLERVAVLADQLNNVVKITLDEKSEIMKVTADAQDVGSGSESIPIKFIGESIQIAFNVRYVLEGLKSIDSDLVVLNCNSPNTPVILSAENSDSGFLYLVMPVQIRT